MGEGGISAAGEDALRWRALARLYHALLTGTLLRLAVQKGSPFAADFIFRLFRRQHLETFLPGLEKLGLKGLPDAVACAQYHFLSNQIGGVRVEYTPETDRKAWVRYAPPRWIWEGTAICGITTEMSAAVLHGWHGHNGVSLGNPRLGFVCTKMAVDGQDGLEGYYYEYDRPIGPDERVRFSRGEQAPPFDPALAPRPPAADWPQARLDKAARNYSIEYIRSILAVAGEILAPDEARWLIGGAAQRIGMHFYDECRALSAVPGEGAAGFAEYYVAMARAEGDEAQWTPTPGGARLARRGLRTAGEPGGGELALALHDSLWAGQLAAANRFLAWNAHDGRDGGIVREIGPARRPEVGKL